MTTVNLELLLAEIEVFPFTSRAAFDGQIGAVERQNLLLSPGTRAIAAELELRLRPHAAGLSLEVLQQIRDRTWFGGHPASAKVVLSELLRRLATSYLRIQGASVSLKRGHEPDADARIERWRWISLLVPQDLLIAACAADMGCDPPCDHVELGSVHVRRLLEQPVAETHLHLGGALTFSTLWGALLAGLAARDPKDRLDVGASDPGVPFGEADRFVRMLLAAAIGRYCLGRYLSLAARRPELRWRDPEVSTGRGDNWLATIAADALVEPADLRAALDLLRTGRLPERAADGPLRRVHGLTSLYRRLTGLLRVRTPSPRTMRDEWERGADPVLALRRWLDSADPLAGEFGRRRAATETVFVQRALRYLLRCFQDARGGGDADFGGLFWQYQRVRNLTFRYLTQEPGVSGLDWFRRHFRRIDALRRCVDPRLPASAVAIQTEGVCLRSLEVRVAIDKRWSTVHRLVQWLAMQGRPGGSLELGLVVHFLKEREWRRGRRLHADPSAGARYRVWSIQRLREATAITGCLERFPQALHLLRGVDVASSELAMPTWPLLPLIDRVRSASEAAAARLCSVRPHSQLRPIQVTCHAGEDYRRLVEGLRRIHEWIEFGALRPGDRIGHALALGDAPERWAGVPAVFQPLEERLDDLLWELERYARGQVHADVQRLEYVRAEIHRLSRAMYSGEAFDPYDLIAARRLRHDVDLLRRWRYPHLSSVAGPDPRDRAKWALWLYLTDPGVFARSQEPVEVRSSGAELPLVRALQDWLRREVAGMELTIESNPSSNLLIGAFVGLDRHPALRLHPLPNGEHPGERVMLSVNTDDPLTFATTLAGEYAYIYYALLSSGVTSQDALQWLDAARVNGMRSRFTLPSSTDCDILADLVRG